MTYFSNITKSDRIQFEGQDVLHITEYHDKDSKELLHLNLTIRDPEKGAVVRKFKPEEIPYLLDAELLIVDRGYHSIARQTDRQIYGSQEVYGASSKQRARVDRMLFLAKRMAHYHLLGMPLTRAGVHAIREELEAEYKRFQARVDYGTETANSTQSLKPLPADCTLLGYFLKYRKGNRNPNVFLRPRSRTGTVDQHAKDDFQFVMEILRKYARGAPNVNDAEPIALPSKDEIAEEAIQAVEDENARRMKEGASHLILKRSAKTYVRWIDKYLDPFTVAMQRTGIEAARREFGSIETGRPAQIPGQIVMFDAWKFHVVTLDTTRERWNQMTEEERKAIKRVRRWVVVAIDVATRVILGYSICRNPNEHASLEALRMCFVDKTYILRNAGISGSDWDYRCPMISVATDSGSEFGKHPFGGASFSAAVRRLSTSFMNTTAGVPELRGYIERWFRTVDLRLTCNMPGWTASGPHKLNDRKPHEEACVTDDELGAILAAYIADYHTRPHRGLNSLSPATAWQKFTENEQYDADQLPGPTALREACGFHVNASISQKGISYAGVAYSNEVIRNQRTTRVADRIAKGREKLEIIVDPFDLGGISVLTGDDVISVPAINPKMRGKKLRDWKLECEQKRHEAELDKQLNAEKNKEARSVWKGYVKAAMKTHDTGLFGYTEAEVAAAAREIKYGKGIHEKPFIGELEYQDPVHHGFEIGDGTPDPVGEAQSEVDPDEKNGLDRFRSKAKRRNIGKSQGAGK